jgi:hypothetical protein
MTEEPTNPQSLLECIPAIVLGCLIPGEIRVILLPGVGLADGGAPADIPAQVIPSDLRMPNTTLWIRLDDDWEVVRVWRRQEGEW